MSDSPAGRYAVKVVRDARIPTADPGVTLSADVYLPADAGPVPALVSVYPYRKDAAGGIRMAPDLHWFASRGYASVLVDLMGTGSSDGRQRPALDAGDADDGVATVEWAVAQPWCDGTVGMWGGSYGGAMTLRTAARRPAALKAIVPISTPLDPERDFVHPGGLRGGYAPLPQWGLGTFLTQLMPPLENWTSTDQQRRWQARLELDPWVVDLFRHGPGDPAWRSRVVDTSGITVPAWVVAGWRDLFCDGTFRAYEQIDAPKKLLAGPWMHTTPHTSPFDAIEFRPLMLRWWDHWLRGIGNDIMSEPPVTLFVQGHSPGWRSYQSWPPPAKDMGLAAVTGHRLTSEEGGATPEPASGSAQQGVLLEGPLDPTTGALNGLWTIGISGPGLLGDQHADDMRTLAITSDPLPHELVVVGRPAATVRVAPDCEMSRLVVNLIAVDPHGRATLVTSGAAPCLDDSGAVEVLLTPTAYRISAGHRVRVTVTDADFPRRWPATSGPGRRLRLTSLDLAVQAVPDSEGIAVEMPPLGLPEPELAALAMLALGAQRNCEVTRDLTSDVLSVDFSDQLSAWTLEREHQIDQDRRSTATVSPDGSSHMDGTATATIRMGTGETVVVRAEVHLTEGALFASGQVTIDDTTFFSRQWRV